MVNSPADGSAVEPRSIPGAWMVLVILVLGLVSTTTLWWYSMMQVGPFRELREAIHSEFPMSAPQVEGGQRKIHRGTPKILRITLRVDSDPRENGQDVRRLMDRLVSLAEQHHGLGSYDLLDVHIVWFRPEQKAVTHHEQREVRQLIESGHVRRVGS